MESFLSELIPAQESQGARLALDLAGCIRVFETVPYAVPGPERHQSNLGIFTYQLTTFRVFLPFQGAFSSENPAMCTTVKATELVCDPHPRGERYGRIDQWDRDIIGIPKNQAPAITGFHTSV